MDETNTAHHDYYTLTPDCVLDAVEKLGVRCDGRLLALNSYENRVYQVGIEEQAPWVVKFYRPNRWSNASILEEHDFTRQLADREIPVVAPIYDAQGQSLHVHQGFRYAAYPCYGGRWPELDNADNRKWLGRFIARIHALGASQTFEHRPSVDIDSYGIQSLNYLMEHDVVPFELQSAYRAICNDILIKVEQCFKVAGEFKVIRLHADCHPGNILWTQDGPHFVDFDDARNGPAIQDLWMLLSGDRQQMTEQLTDILDAYTEFHDFDARQLNLVEPLRSLRMIHYSAWLARRWDDPSFQINFPWFIETKYWEQQILSLKEQLALMDEPPLRWQ